MLDGDGFLASAEVYDPGTGEWAPVAPMAMPRAGHTSTLLSDGRVMVVGGYVTSQGASVPDPLVPGALAGAHLDGPSAEIFDPRLGAWLPAGGPRTPRSDHVATLLEDGGVLLAGGNDPRTGEHLASAELYDPARGSWAVTGSLRDGRAMATATALPDGTVLVAGGYRPDAGWLGSVERYDPRTAAWRPAPSMAPVLSLEGALLLPRGGVLVVGCTQGATRTMVELFRLGR